MKEPIINNGFDDIRVGNIIEAKRMKEVQGLCPMGRPKCSFFCLKDRQIYVQETENGDFQVTSIGHSPMHFIKTNSQERER